MFKSLSEGEKTLITFLYFIELCHGTTDDAEENINPSNRIIIIDDPISSLGLNLVFEVSELIFKYFIEKEYQQIILLTHHLYFFHEFTKGRDKFRKDNVEYYKITKYKRSEIKKLAPDSIRNNYESYWHIIQDIQNGNKNEYQVMLLNAMRHVLEYFFAFLKPQRKLKKILEEMRKNDSLVTFKAFKRYLDRSGSHSDPDAIIEEIQKGDNKQYFEYFKEIFEEMKLKSHYEEMMNSMQDTQKSNTK